MDKWNLLPPEVLELVFRHLGSDVPMTDFSDDGLIFLTKDLFQCQLTCKNWAPVAQIMCYENIFLKNLQVFTAFGNTLRDNSRLGPLVKFICFWFLDYEENFREILARFLHQLAHSSPDFRRLYSGFDSDPIIYETIRHERVQNRFLKLERIPFNFNHNENCIEQYNMTADLFQQSFRELTIYEKVSESFEDKERLKKFGNIEFLIFNLFNCSNVYNVDKLISICPTVKNVYISCSDDTNTAYSSISKINYNTCPQVEDLDVIGIECDIRICTYLMNVFPNLKDFILDSHLITTSTSKLSKDTALQFLHYLFHITNASILDIPMENINDIMMKFHDSSNIIKTLDIEYYKHDSSYLRKLYKTNSIARIVVQYDGDELVFLPRTGLIEESGNNLHSIKINMFLKFDDMKMIADNQDKPDLLSYLMERCSNLHSIFLKCSFLYFSNSSIVEIIPSSRKLVEVANSLIHPSFFLGLSYYASYIEKFIISRCKFTDEEQNGNNNNISIDMPNTIFGSINYEDNISVDNIYLMMTTTEDSSTIWYHGTTEENSETFRCYSTTSNYKICEEEEYQLSLKDKKSLSINLHCKSSVSTIEVSRLKGLYG